MDETRTAIDPEATRLLFARPWTFVRGMARADDLPPIASGGRYDTLTSVLGQGRGLPAVGGIVRPEALLALGGGGEEG